MSYRNDHDAALARIDALEAELELLSRTAPAAPTPAPKKTRWMLPAMLACVGVGSIAVLGIAGARGASVDHEQAHAALAPIVPAVPTPSMPTERTKLLACVDQLDAHIARHDASTDACLATLTTETADTGLGTDIHATVIAWRAAETGHSWDDREDLAPKIHAYIIPSFTR